MNPPESARDFIYRLCATVPSGQSAINVEDLSVLIGKSRNETCQLLLDMRSRNEIELSIFHPVAVPESDLPKHPHCVPYDQWIEWQPFEFFSFGVHDQGRIRINLRGNDAGY